MSAPVVRVGFVRAEAITLRLILKLWLERETNMTKAGRLRARKALARLNAELAK